MEVNEAALRWKDSWQNKVPVLGVNDHIFRLVCEDNNRVKLQLFTHWVGGCNVFQDIPVHMEVKVHVVQAQFRWKQLLLDHVFASFQLFIIPDFLEPITHVYDFGLLSHS